MLLARPAVIASIALALGVSGSGFTATAEDRIDRNFEPLGASGPKIPAIPAAALKVTEGSVKVRIGFQKFTLETITVLPPGDGPFPLAVVSHGTPTRGGKAALRTLRIRQMLPIAEDFARRGYKAVVFARRGYASSTGQFQEGYGRCKNANEASYVRLARKGAKDYAAIIKALVSEPDVDGSTVIAAGHSGGGFVVSALASNPPPGLKAVINFAGGRGGTKEQGNCSEAGFVGAFGDFGRGATVPALWLYATSDRMFWPELIDRALAAYAQNGAPVRLDRVGPCGSVETGTSFISPARESCGGPGSTRSSTRSVLRTGSAPRTTTPLRRSRLRETLASAVPDAGSCTSDFRATRPLP